MEGFAELQGIPVKGPDKSMPFANAEGVGMVNFGMGSHGVVMMTDPHTCIEPKACGTPASLRIGMVPLGQQFRKGLTERHLRF